MTDGCSGIGNGKNNNYTSDGYYYAVDFTAAGSANLQVFDPALVNVGQFCDTRQRSPRPPRCRRSPATRRATTTPPTSRSASARSATRTTRPTRVGSTAPATTRSRTARARRSSPNTTYTVLKATVPGHPESATQACPPITYQGFNGNIATALATNNPNNFAKYFRQWATLCTVNGNKGDEYFIQVQTDNGGGSNHFALRGVNGGNNAAPVTIAGNTYMGMWANVGSNQLTKFYLVRVPSAAKSHTLVLNFYDIGDANSQGTLQVIPPSDATGSNISGGVFNSGCQWSGNTTNGARRLRGQHPGRAVGHAHRGRNLRTARSPASTAAESGTRSGAR